MFIMILSIFAISTQAKNGEETQMIPQITGGITNPPPNEPTYETNDDRLSDDSGEDKGTDDGSDDKGKRDAVEEADKSPPADPPADNAPPTTNTPSSSSNDNVATNHATTNQNTENTQETVTNRNVILAGNMHEFIPTNCETTGFYKVNLRPTVDLDDPILTIKTVEELPEEIPEYSGEYNIVFKYLDIKITSDDGEYLTEDKISSLSFNFELKNSEVLGKNIDLSNIKLVRYHDGWQELTTVASGVNEEKIYFEATTPGLSTFAIVGENVEESDSSTHMMGSNIPEIPGFVLIAIIIFGVIGILVFLVKSRDVYIDKGVMGEEIIQDRKVPFEY